MGAKPALVAAARKGVVLGDRDRACVGRRGAGWVAADIDRLGAVCRVINGCSGGDAGDGHIDGRLVVTAVGRKLVSPTRAIPPESLAEPGVGEEK